jgi:hypothetical protein
MSFSLYFFLFVAGLHPMRIKGFFVKKLPNKREFREDVSSYTHTLKGSKKFPVVCSIFIGRFWWSPVCVFFTYYSRSVLSFFSLKDENETFPHFLHFHPISKYSVKGISTKIYSMITSFWKLARWETYFI